MDLTWVDRDDTIDTGRTHVAPTVRMSYGVHVWRQRNPFNESQTQAVIEELRQTSHWSLSRKIVDGSLVVMTSPGLVRKECLGGESMALQALDTVPHRILIMKAGPEMQLVIDANQAGHTGRSVYDETGQIN